MDNRNFEVEEETIDIKKIISLLVKNWYWFAISVFLFFVGAFLWNFYSTPIFQVEAKILINDEGSTFMDPQMMVSQVFSPNTYKVKKEMEVLGSYSLTAEAISKLPLEASWWKENDLRSVAIYPPPYRVVIDSSHFQSDSIEFSILKIDSLNVLLSGQYEDADTWSDTVRINKYVEAPGFRFKVVPNLVIDVNERFNFKLNRKEDLVKYFNEIDLSEEKYASTIIVRFKDASASRAVDFLNSLSQSFLKRGVKRKNLIALNTIKFIESQLHSVVDSLRFSAERLEKFRRVKGATNLDFQSQKAYELLDGLEREKAQYTVFLNYYDYLKKSITQNMELDKLVVPSAMGVGDELLNKLVLELIQFYSEKAEIAVNTKKDNPMIGAIDYKIEDRKKTILETINGLTYSARLGIKNLDERIQKYQTEVSKIPEKEKELLAYQRNFNLNDEIYTFLLKKRSELQIASASNFPENEVLDPASVVRSKIVSPNKKLNYLVAFLLSIIIPFLVFYLRNQLIDKFEESDQLNNLGFPVIGELIHSESNNTFVVNKERNTAFSEAYRLLRTNIKFLIGGGQSRVVLVTSTFSGEGKSFVSRNIAASFALAGHKTLLMDCDLRKVDSNLLARTKKEQGLSSFLSNNASYNDIVVSSDVDNLWIIPSGMVPPNATELIDSPKMLELMDIVRDKFEIIIIDSPPIGMVADSYILAQQSDLLLFIIRYKHSRLNGVERILSSIFQKNIKKVALVTNDINSKYFRYGYYGSKYGYGYYYGYSGKKKK